MTAIDFLDVAQIFDLSQGSPAASGYLGLVASGAGAGVWQWRAGRYRPFAPLKGELLHAAAM
jgi:hypothetical protein